MALVGLMYSSTPRRCYATQCTSKPQPLRHVGKQFTSYGSCSFDHHWSAPTSDPSYSLTLNSPLRCSCYVYILTASAEKRPKHQPLHIKHNLSSSLVILRICFLAVWVDFTEASSKIYLLNLVDFCWSATSCELHPIPLLWKCQGRFNKKGVGSNVQRLFCSIPTQLPPPMQ